MDCDVESKYESSIQNNKTMVNAIATWKFGRIAINKCKEILSQDSSIISSSMRMTLPPLLLPPPLYHILAQPWM